MLIDLLEQAGLTAAWWPDDGDVVIIHAGQFRPDIVLPEQVVLLYRMDTVAQAVSWSIASQNGGWTEPGPAQYDEESIRNGLERIELDNQMLAEMATYTLAYEDLVANPAGTIEALWGARPTGPPRTKRLSNSINEEFISRWKSTHAPVVQRIE